MPEQMDARRLFCAACGVKNCTVRNPDPGRYPKGCPSLKEELPGYLQEYLNDPETRLIAQKSSLCGPDHSEPRLPKTMRFLKMCGYTRIGLAFCVNLRKEAQIVDRILRENGFEVYSLACKVGGYDRSVLGLEESCKNMCNPIAQAGILKEAGTQFNIALGLCVGHDTLFIKYSAAPVTVLAAKDHVYNHAPLEYLKDYLREKETVPVSEERKPDEKDC